jgi:hypothetical protein
MENAYKMQEFVYSNLTMLKNKPKVLGNQLLFDEEDEITGEETRLLSFATSISFEDIIKRTWELGGIAIPAHIDRPSYSVISNLGILPENEHLTCLEVSQYGDFNLIKDKYPHYQILQCSDSHELGFIGVCERTFDIPLEASSLLDAKTIIEFLRQKKL